MVQPRIRWWRVDLGEDEVRAVSDVGPRSTPGSMKNGWNRTPETGPRTPDSGTTAETETVTESETVTGFTWPRRSSRTPDSGPRTPDPGSRTGSDTVTVTVTDTVADTVTVRMEPVTTEPTVPFSGNCQ